MDLMIRGRKAIVAGGSAGIGKAAAEVLAREGAEVVLGARGEARLRAVAAQMAQETGAKVTPVAGDHGTIEGRAALAAACPEPDILVISVSPPPQTPDYRTIEPDQWGQALTTNLVGPIELMRMFVPGMCDRGFGRVVNIATVAAKFPIELRLLSGAPRAALMNYTSAVAKKAARHNVTINNVLPGMYLTERFDEMIHADAKAAGQPYNVALEEQVRRYRIPARRFGDPAELAPMIAMLCSPFAGYAVSQNLVFDGGMGNALA